MLVKAKEMSPQVSISVTVYFPHTPQIIHLGSTLSIRYIFMRRLNESKQRRQDIQPIQGITAKGNSVLLFLKEIKEQVSSAFRSTAQKRVSCRHYSPLTPCTVWSNRLLLVQQRQVPCTWEARTIRCPLLRVTHSSPSGPAFDPFPPALEIWAVQYSSPMGYLNLNSLKLNTIKNSVSQAL